MILFVKSDDLRISQGKLVSAAVHLTVKCQANFIKTFVVLQVWLIKTLLDSSLSTISSSYYKYLWC